MMDALTQAGFLAHATLPVYQRRMAQAKEWVKAALKICKNPYVAWSVGGKDSSVMLDLALKETLIEARVLVSGETRYLFPEFDEIVMWWRSKYGDRLTISLVETDRVWSGNMSFDEQRKAGRNDIMKLLPTERHDLVFLGLRDEESNVRRIANAKGIIRRYAMSRRKNIRGKYVCVPVARLSTADIAAYIITKQIPVFNVYTEQGFEERTTLRLTGDAVRQMAFQRLRITNPKEYNALLYRFPELNRWNG